MSDEPLLSRQFNLAFLASMFYGISFAVFVHVGGFFVGIGADEPRVGVILGLGSVGGMVIRPTLGIWLDRYGRKRFAMIGAVVKVFSTLLFVTVTTASGIWPILVALLHGLSEALLYTSMATVGADVVPASRRTEGLALFGVSGQAPLAIGGVLGDFLIRIGGFSLLFYASAFLAGVALLTIALLEEPAPRNVGERTGLVQVLVRPRLRPMWAVAFSFSMALTVFFVFLRTFVDETGIGSVGLFFLVYSGVAITLRIVGPRLPDQVGVERMLVVTQVCLAAGLVVLAATDSVAYLVIAAFLAGVGHGYAFPIILSLVTSRARDADRGTAISLFLLMFPVATLVGGPVGGYLIKIAGYPGMFAAFAALVVVMAAVFQWSDSRLSEPTTV
jgi:MFS family permease